MSGRRLATARLLWAAGKKSMVTSTTFMHTMVMMIRGMGMGMIMGMTMGMDTTRGRGGAVVGMAMGDVAGERA